MEEKKPYSKRTKKELMADIREATRRVNRRIFEYRMSDFDHRIVNQSITRMRDISGVSRTRGYNEVGVGKIQKKTKEELVLQLRELESFERWDVFTPQARRTLERRERKAWETFSKRHPGWTYEEWRKYAELAGALGETKMQQFGSDTVLEDFKVASTTDQNKFLPAMQQAIRESKDKGWIKEELWDRAKQIMEEI